MRKCILISLLLPVLAHPQKKLTAESSISGVTVFTSGAQIIRQANVTILPGRTEIAFNGLSNQLEQQSLQLKADANITLLSVQTIKDYSSQRKSENGERSLIERRTELQEEIENDKRLLQVYKKEEEMLEKNQSIGGQTGVKAEDLKLALDLHRIRMTEVLQKQMELEKRIASQQNELNKASAQLNEISKKQDSVNYTVVAVIDSKETQNIRFQLTYHIKDAGWYPTYDVRVNDVTKPLDVLMNANVFQRSGETWKDVAVQLSSGNPAANATPSELQPWMLGFYDPAVAWLRSQATMPGVISGRVLDDKGTPVAFASVTVKGSFIGTTTDANGFFKIQNVPANASLFVSAVGLSSKEIKALPGYYTVSLTPSQQNLEEVVVTGYALSGRTSGLEINDSYPRKQTREIQPVSVTMQYQPTAIIYKIDERYTLETDGKTTTISIKKMQIPALYEYYSAPKIDPSVFLTAKVVNSQDYDLQPGETNLYYEGTFLGKTYLDLSGTGDTLSLPLGKDNSIKISRKLSKEFSSKKFIGSHRLETKEFEITVMNSKRQPVNLIIQDQFPVSVAKEIDVEDESAPEAQLNKENGMVTWNITLQPGQEKKYKMTYAVRYPKDRKVVLE